MAENNPTEEWRAVEGWPYEVSNLGRVKRMKAVPGVRAGTILNPVLRRRGYFVVTLQEKPRIKQAYVSRLVCRAFHGEPPDESYDAAHNDGDSQNNRSDNLRWDTRKGNLADCRRHGTSIDGERNGACKLTGDQVQQIILLEGVASRVDVAAQFGVTRSWIGRIWRGTARVHG